MSANIPRYVGETDGQTWWKVTVYGDEDGVPKSLDPCLHIRAHSPDGFAWSYSGSGPHQLALALLCHALKGHPDRFDLARKHYRDLVTEVITKMPIDQGFEIEAPEIVAWVKRKEGMPT